MVFNPKTFPGGGYFLQQNNNTTGAYPAGCTSSLTGMSKARTTFINTLTSLTVKFYNKVIYKVLVRLWHTESTQRALSSKPITRGSSKFRSQTALITTHLFRSSWEVTTKLSKINLLSEDSMTSQIIFFLWVFWLSFVLPLCYLFSCCINLLFC